MESPDLRLNLSLRKGRATISVDLGGGPLHRRGWRMAQNEAPLKENLAAAVLMRGGWPRAYADGGGLLDPMCGSGTLLIEGALMAADVAPGLQRYGSDLPSRWRGFDRNGWQQLVSEARERDSVGRAALKQVIHGSDMDPHAIRAAKENAQVAGVAEAIWFGVCEVGELQTPPQATGVVVCNPPYDERLAADAALYRRLGDTLQCAVPQWRASLLCGNAELAYATGLRAGKKYQLFNGAIECALIVCDPIAVPRRTRWRHPPRSAKARRWWPIGCARICRNSRSGARAKASNASAPTTPICRNILPPSTCTSKPTATGASSCMCRNTQRQRRFPRPMCAVVSTNCWPPHARSSRYRPSAWR